VFFLFGFSSTGTSHASDLSDVTNAEKIKVTVINDETGETSVTVLNPKI